MRTRLDPEHLRAHAGDVPAAALALQPAVPVLPPFDPDSDLGNALPSDHPAWVRDAVSISQRARQLFATLKPVTVRVMTLWDHAVRAIVVGGRRLEVDASGSYRMP